jgi:predicted PolB exonuclease-like 3'-5' exonuclease
MRNFDMAVLLYKKEFRYPDIAERYLDSKEQLWYDC